RRMNATGVVRTRVVRKRRKRGRGAEEARTRLERAQSACNKIRNVIQKVSPSWSPPLGARELQPFPGAQEFADAPGLRDTSAGVMGRPAIVDFPERAEAVGVERLKRRLQKGQGRRAVAID